MGGIGFRDLVKISLVFLPCLIDSCSSVKKPKTLDQYPEILDSEEISDRDEPNIYNENHGVTHHTFVVQPLLQRRKRAWENQAYTVPYGHSGQDVDFSKLNFLVCIHIVSCLKK